MELSLCSKILIFYLFLFLFAICYCRHSYLLRAKYLFLSIFSCKPRSTVVPLN
ncbi:MAG: hypothetical protein AVDCRST_MAG96-857 [uncultured Segetibacter sp.]|uniref:Uncharacterized protein n=1 Tax=uncultured Segetibacter sp. TaxID=481133 RepID=A0A6J4RVC3_9BACT|nr:MAG: hypothetical protein AVDCRST_MAG96-857 [uncultured Segetibacter sp.]